jgi:hypothetical protein
VQPKAIAHPLQEVSLQTELERAVAVDRDRDPGTLAQLAYT